MSLAVREEIIDDHANNREEKNDERPDNLVGDRTVRFENLDCGTETLAIASEREPFITIKVINLLQAMMSSTSTITEG